MKYYQTLAFIALTHASSATHAQKPQLEEIIVTAEFRKTTLQDQSASTSVVSAHSIVQRSAQHLEEILNLVPNVNFASGASRARFYQIRGIGERSQFQEPLNASIGFVIDGIDFSGLGTAGTLFDVDQVEVLRGPQGTLHGANALAGLINIRTAAPTTEPFAKIELSASEYDTWSAGIVGSGPLMADELLYRLSFNTVRSDGFIENDFLAKDDTNNRDETTVRGKLRWLPNDDDSVDLSAMYVDIDNGYDAFTLDNSRNTLSDEPGQDIQETLALSVAWNGQRERMNLEATVTAAASETDYGYDEDWTFVGIAPELEYSSTDQYLRDRDSYSAEFRMLSNEQSRVLGGTSDWVLGLYYLGDREDLSRRYTFNAQDFESTYDTDTYAVFGQLDSQLSERLTIVSGLRLESRKTQYSDNNAVDTDLDRSLWGGKLVLEYTLDSNRMAYAGVSRGYRAYGINAQILASISSTDDPTIGNQLRGVQDYDDEHLLNYEVGYKASYSENRVRSRLAVFYMDRQDQQLKGSFLVEREDGSTAFIDYTNNTAKGNNYGLELEL
ncbi:MAG: outer membrane receptor protein involved in Fe transport, partial [Bacteroidia bacterium]